MRLSNEGTPQVQVVIDVINHRDEDVMAVDFVSGIGKSSSGGLAMGLYQEDNPVVIIPRHGLKTFDFF